MDDFRSKLYSSEVKAHQQKGVHRTVKPNGSQFFPVTESFFLVPRKHEVAPTEDPHLAVDAPWSERSIS